MKVKNLYSLEVAVVNSAGYIFLDFTLLHVHNHK